MRLTAVFASTLIVCASGEATESASVLWTFDNEVPGETHGQLQLAQEQLQTPIYPGFAATNQVLQLKAPSWIVISDEGTGSHYDFDVGDEITLEAWVNVHTMGDNVYLVGKGRTERSGSRAINQNWALRLRKANGQTCLSFLFRSRKSDSHDGDWHRWTTKTGFVNGSRWHHVAVCYRFGEPSSIRGFIDGQVVEGRWDMGGPTKAPPVVDDDAVWIGSAMGGNKGNSLDGAIDQIAIHRYIVPDKELRDRFQWNPPELKVPVVPENKVTVQLFGPLPSHRSIPEYTESPLSEWHQDSLAFIRLPHRYNEWGTRADWGSTMLVRAWTEVDLPPGDHRLLIRSRGLSQLYVDGEPVLSTEPQQNYSGAHHAVRDLPEVPFPGMRPHAMSDNEQVAFFRSAGGRHFVRWDIVVGGPTYRLEFGETCMAVAQPDKMFQIAGPATAYPLTDAGWQECAAETAEVLDALDRSNRQRANRQTATVWSERHRHAREHLITQDPIPSIDAVIQARVERLRTAASHPAQQDASASFFTEQVQPIFESHCNRCHGQKVLGGILLSSRERLLAGGDSGDPAVVPGNPDESVLFQLISADADDYRMPPKGDGPTPEEVKIIHHWIAEGAAMPQLAPATPPSPEPIEDHQFLRRVFVDAVGVPPSLREIQQFFATKQEDRRQAVIDRLLQDDRWADNWVGYWQDVLAENPNLLKPTLNNTGPFRFWIHEALTDNKSIDRFATELIMMHGSTWGGGPAGFAVASQNDVPMAAKAHVIGSAFLGINLKCARCHDAPYHQWQQSDLFHLAAMLDRRAIKLPDSSTVPAAFFEQQEREPLIDVTLEPDTSVIPRFPFAEVNSLVTSGIIGDLSDSRAQLAAQVTSSRRFAEVIANRVWQRLMGAGLVVPVDDWEGHPASDPELLRTLADTLINVDYDLRKFAGVIFSSRAYQSQASDRPTPQHAPHPGSYRRRMTAEQIVDSAYHVVGKKMRTEQLTLDVEGTLPADRFLNFGYPQRAWEFTTLANERDRPSLALPRAQSVVDVLQAFGWRDSRPEPSSSREESPNLLQPGALANGTLGIELTRLTDDGGITNLMLQKQTVEELVDAMFLSVLTRPPTSTEKAQFVALLDPGFTDRVVSETDLPLPTPSPRFRYVSWSNHLSSEANVIKLQIQDLIRQGPIPTSRLDADWRRRAEDALWSLINSPEAILLP